VALDLQSGATLGDAAVTIANAASLSTAGGALTDATALDVDGTFTLAGDETIATLAGEGTVALAGHTLAVGSGVAGEGFAYSGA
ncbi:hypothetical protein, partial [Tritonibacter sp. SIMBA_163]